MKQIETYISGAVRSAVESLFGPCGDKQLQLSLIHI